MDKKVCQGQCSNNCNHCIRRTTETPSRVKSFPEPYPAYVHPKWEPGMTDEDMRHARGMAHVAQYEAGLQWK